MCLWVCSVGENAAVGNIVGEFIVATDVDAGDTLSFSLLNTTVFSVVQQSSRSPATAQLRTNMPLLGLGVFSVGVRVTDSRGLAAVASIAITIVERNDPPIVLAAAFNVSEGAAVGDVVGQVIVSEPEGQDVTYRIARGDVGGRFAISDSGVITVARSTLDFETIPQFELGVEVTDVPVVATDALTSSATITLFVTNVNEAPELDPPSWVVPEDARLGAAVGMPIQGSDVDAGDVLSYTIVSTGAPFAINATSGQLRVASAPLDFETDALYTMTVRVTDAAGLWAEALVTVAVLDVNEQPQLVVGALSIAENAPAGSIVGVVTGTDVDARDTLRFFIVAGGAGFALDPSTGLLTQTAVGLDFERQSSYALLVMVRDFGGLNDTGVVVVNVTNVNDVTVTGFAGSLLHATNGDETVVIIGTNLGSFEPGVNSSFVVTYGSTDAFEFVAQSCAMQAGSNATRLQCRTQAGSGVGLRWRVVVTAAGIPGDVAVSTATTAYLPPSVLNVSSSAVDMRTVVRAMWRECVAL